MIKYWSVRAVNHMESQTSQRNAKCNAELQSPSLEVERRRRKVVNPLVRVSQFALLLVGFYKNWALYFSAGLRDQLFSDMSQENHAKHLELILCTRFKVSIHLWSDIMCCHTRGISHNHSRPDTVLASRSKKPRYNRDTFHACLLLNQRMLLIPCNPTLDEDMHVILISACRPTNTRAGIKPEANWILSDQCSFSISFLYLVRETDQSLCSKATRWVQQVTPGAGCVRWSRCEIFITYLPD